MSWLVRAFDDFRAFAILCAAFFAFSVPASAQGIAFKQAVAEAAAANPSVGAFYRDRDYAPIWTGAGEADKARRGALLNAIAEAGLHGLPASKYSLNEMTSRLGSARTMEELAALEVYLSNTFLAYARDVQTGMLTPANVDEEIVRDVPLRDGLETLNAFVQSDPSTFIAGLPPQTHDYTRLMRAKMDLEREIARGGWGPTVPANSLKPGATGNDVVALRNRLIAMGFLERSTTRTYDADITAAVERFQIASGLEADGVAGRGTIAFMNTSMRKRLEQVHVAMERERWLNRPEGLGERHIWVNLTDFTAQIRDNGVVSFKTRSVIGAHDRDRRSPEFSDVMEHMVINPSWYVPRSIATKEYLPQLQADPNAVSHLEITDVRGRRVNREEVDFSQYSTSSFPFDMRQPPSRSNALGLVKFMFPNRYNIYLHDTPHKRLFAREVRAFSHGCIRLNDPFDFAYALLAVQTADPEGFFKSQLNTGRETTVELERHVPVHLVYRTAVTTAEGGLEFRRDVYGRDARIWEALQREGVVLGGIQG